MYTRDCLGELIFIGLGGLKNKLDKSTTKPRKGKTCTKAK